ncbi:MAG: hypothetical protein JJU09_13595 [Rhodobacteraceae bacterium]|nr:hypothetical protein [Paracoccaceae bacterium]
MTALNGTAARLAQLVSEHADYEFEGFRWVACQIEGLADELGRSVNTVRKVIGQPPFHYITRCTKEDGKHILLKLGDELCETDHVNILRGIWVRGLVRFNAALEHELRCQIDQLAGLQNNSDQVSRLKARLENAAKGAAPLAALQAGKKISLMVEPKTMGLLRGCVQTFGADAPDVLRRLITFEGWHNFATIIKIEERTSRYYHWPALAEINRNPDIALQIYLDLLQSSGSITLHETDVMFQKIAAFEQAQMAAE